MRARVPFAFRNPKTSGGRSRGVKGEWEGSEEKAKFSARLQERRRNRRDVISIDDDDDDSGDGGRNDDDDEDGEIEERKG